MTTREFIEMAGSHWLTLLCLFVLPPLAAWLCGLAHGRDNGGNAPWKYFYSVLVYLTCVPGTFAAVLTGYTLFFSHENLLDVNPLVYFLPIISMVVTLVLIRKNVAFDLVPGFDRLSGLMVMIACSFAIALAIQKTNIFLFFGGSIEKLMVLAVAVFALLKWGVYTLFRKRDEPRQVPPQFPGV
jgi:hypothetical protein